MFDKFDKWFYEDFMKNPSNYRVEFGKAYDFTCFTESWKSITIFDPTIGTFKSICKINYKDNEYACLGWMGSGGSDLIDLSYIQEIIYAIEDYSGKTINEFYNS